MEPTNPPKLTKNPRMEQAKFAITILIVVVLGLIAVNQILAFKYKSEFLQKPCELCAELNKNQTKCISQCFSKEVLLNPYADGQWKDLYGNCYTSEGEPTPCKGINLSGLQLSPD